MNVFDIFFIGKKADYMMLNYIQIKLTYIQIKQNVKTNIIEL